MKIEKNLISTRNWNCAGANCSRQETIFHVLSQLVLVQTVLVGFKNKCYN
jgi:hypothetical protein